MRIKTYLIGGLLLLTVVLPVQVLQAQVDTTQHAVDPEKAEAIRTFLELTKVAEYFLLGFEEAMAVQPEDPDIPAGFLEQVQVKVREKLPQLIDLLVPLYDRHLTLEELNGLIDFLRTPLGQRFVSLQMELADETAQLGERWGMMLAAEVLMDLAKKPPQ